MDRSVFFAAVKASVFGGRLGSAQIAGMTKILDYRDAHYIDMSDMQLAYLLATVKHETGHKMVPVREGGGEVYLRKKPYYPWVGEGLVQVTWAANARKFGAQKPGDCMTWPIALCAAFEGMTKGMFTGKKLSDFINDDHVNFSQARRIINGTDRAALIAGYAQSFADALQQSREALTNAPQENQATGKPLVQSKTAWAAGVSAAAGGVPVVQGLLDQAQPAYEAARQATDLAAGSWELFLRVGPWALAVVAIAVAAYVVISERRKKSLELGV